MALLIPNSRALAMAELLGLAALSSETPVSTHSMSIIAIITTDLVVLSHTGNI